MVSQSADSRTLGSFVQGTVQGVQATGGGYGQCVLTVERLHGRISVAHIATTFLPSACPGRDLYHGEAAPGIPNHVPVAGTCRVSAAVGKVKWNVAPRPLFAVAHKRPPCDSTMERLIANPMPLPWGLVVKKALLSIFRRGKHQFAQSRPCDGLQLVLEPQPRRGVKGVETYNIIPQRLPLFF